MLEFDEFKAKALAAGAQDAADKTSGSDRPSDSEVHNLSDEEYDLNWSALKFQKDEKVILTGLSNFPHFNGTFGVVEDFDDEDDIYLIA